MIYLKFGSVLGDSMHESHTNWIQLRSVNWGLTRPVTNPSGSTAGRVLAAPRVGELSITKDEDCASIPLIQQALSGSPQDVQIEFVSESTSVLYYKIVLKQAVITAFTQGSSGDRPTETLTFNFTKISFEGTQMNKEGTAATPTSYGWDVAANTAA